MITKTKTVDEITAIKAVIDAETFHFKAGNYEDWADCIAQTSLTYYRRASAVIGQYAGMEAFGWEEVSSTIQIEMTTLPAHKYLGTKSHFNFKIMEDMAFVTFLVDEQKECSCVLEKIDYQWLILRMSS